MAAFFSGCLAGGGGGGVVAGLLLVLFLASLSMADLKNFGSNTFYPHYYMSMLMCILYSKYGIWEH
jgi:hypothetical protein